MTTPAFSITSTLENHFLLAMPSMQEPAFQNTIIYLFQHNQNGALGIILNRPTTVSLADVFADMNIHHVEDDHMQQVPVLLGGPVHQERGFVMHRPRGNWRSTLLTANDISITTSRDILEAIAVHEGPEDVLIALGCTAWEPGQLEQELKANHWLHVPATAHITFMTPFELRYTEALELLGITGGNLSTDAGHA